MGTTEPTLWRCRGLSHDSAPWLLSREGGPAVTFDEILAQVREVLERDGRVAYRILKRRFALADEDLEDLKADLIDAKRVARDEEGKVLVWTGGAAQPLTPEPPDSGRRPRGVIEPQAERRQLTVM